VTALSIDISKEKLYLLFARLGDNAGATRSGWKLGWKVGICAGITENAFANKWATLFDVTYSRVPTVRSHPDSALSSIHVTLKSKAIWLDMDKYAQFGKYNWIIRESLINYLLTDCPLEDLGYGLSGFLDADGYIGNQNQYCRVELMSVNENGLNQLRQLLLRMEIKTIKRSNTYRRTLPLHSLCVSNIENLRILHKYITFCEPRKQQLFDDYIEKRKTSPWQAWDIASDQHLEKRFKEQVTDKQIAKELKRSVFAVSQRRENLGLYKRNRHTQIDIEALRRAYKETQSLRKAAKAVGVSYRTAQKTLYSESRWTIKDPKK
jgi:hypothetical protein